MASEEQVIKVETEVEEATIEVAPSTSEMSIQVESALVDSSTCVDVLSEEKASEFEWVTPTTEEGIQVSAATVDSEGSVILDVSENSCEASCQVIDIGSEMEVRIDNKDCQFEFVIETIEASSLACANVTDSGSGVSVEVLDATEHYAYEVPVNDAITEATCEVSDLASSLELSVCDSSDQASATLIDIGHEAEVDVSDETCHAFPEIEEASCDAGSPVSDLVSTEVQTEDMDVEEVIQITTAKKDHAEFFQRVSKMKGGEETWCQTDLSFFDLVETWAQVECDVIEQDSESVLPISEKSESATPEVASEAVQFELSVNDASTSAACELVEKESSESWDSDDKACMFQYVAPSADAECQAEASTVESGLSVEMASEEQVIKVETEVEEATIEVAPSTSEMSIQVESALVDNSTCVDVDVDEKTSGYEWVTPTTEEGIQVSAATVDSEGSVTLDVNDNSCEASCQVIDIGSNVCTDVSETGVEAMAIVEDAGSQLDVEMEDKTCIYHFSAPSSEAESQTEYLTVESGVSMFVEMENMGMQSELDMRDIAIEVSPLMVECGMQADYDVVDLSVISDIVYEEKANSVDLILPLCDLGSCCELQFVDNWSSGSIGGLCESFSYLSVVYGDAVSGMESSMCDSFSYFARNPDDVEGDEVDQIDKDAHALISRVVDVQHRSAWDSDRTNYRSTFSQSEDLYLCDAFSYCLTIANDGCTQADIPTTTDEMYDDSMVMVFEGDDDAVELDISRQEEIRSLRTLEMVDAWSFSRLHVDEACTQTEEPIAASVSISSLVKSLESDKIETLYTRLIETHGYDYMKTMLFGFSDVREDTCESWSYFEDSRTYNDFGVQAGDKYTFAAFLLNTYDHEDLKEIMQYHVTSALKDSSVQASVLVEESLCEFATDIDTSSTQTLDETDKLPSSKMLPQLVDTISQVDLCVEDILKEASLTYRRHELLQVLDESFSTYHIEKGTQTFGDIVDDVSVYTRNTESVNVQTKYETVTTPSQTETTQKEYLLDNFVTEYGIWPLKSYVDKILPDVPSTTKESTQSLKVDERIKFTQMVADFVEDSSQTDKLTIDTALHLAGTSRVELDADIRRYHSALYATTSYEMSEETSTDECTDSLIPSLSSQSTKIHRKRNKRVQRGVSAFSLVSRGSGPDLIEITDDSTQTEVLLSVEELLEPCGPTFLGLELRDRLLALRDRDRPWSVSVSSTELLDDPELYRQPRSRHDSGTLRNWQFTPVTIEGDYIDVNAQMDVVTRTTLTSHHQRSQDLAANVSPQPMQSPPPTAAARVLRHVTTQACQTDPMSTTYLRQELNWWNEQMDEVRSVGINTTMPVDRRALLDLSSDDSSQTGLPTFMSRHLEISQVMRPPPDASHSHEWRIDEVISPRTQQPMPFQLAVQRGVIDLQRGVYIDAVRKMTIPIPTAIEKRLIRQASVTEGSATHEGTHCALLSFVETKNLTVETRTDSYLITSVQDQLRRSPVSLNVALSSDLLNWERGLYFNNRTGQHLHLSEAFRLGYLRGERVTAAIPQVEVIENTFVRFPDEMGN